MDDLSRRNGSGEALRNWRELARPLQGSSAAELWCQFSSAKYRQVPPANLPERKSQRRRRRGRSTQEEAEKGRRWQIPWRALTTRHLATWFACPRPTRRRLGETGAREGQYRPSGSASRSASSRGVHCQARLPRHFRRRQLSQKAARMSARTWHIRGPPRFPQQQNPQ